MAQTHTGPEATGTTSLTKVAVGLAGAALLAMLVLAAADADGPVWLVVGVLAAAGAVVGWRAGGTTPRNVLAFGALVVGTVLFLVFVGFTIAEA